MTVWKGPPLPKKPVIKPKIVEWHGGSEGADVSFTISGAKALQANLLSMAESMRDAAGYEMAIAAHEVIVDAQENYVPVRFGHLKASGDSDTYEPGMGITIAKIAMWFGGVVGPEALEAGVVSANTYALIQHETPPSIFHHEIGQWKYLEIPFMKMQAKIESRIANRIGNTIGGTNRIDEIFEGLTNRPAGLRPLKPVKLPSIKPRK